jgi:nitrogenase molybdenum-iron protein alpha/beta subunit
MTGAAACLAGFEGMRVVIHGSSGCYYYPATLLHAELHGTFILEHEVIFGSEERLLAVMESLAGTGKRIAVITTCVSAVLGEDIRAILGDSDVLLVDSPGFSGDLETGYKKALALLTPQSDPAAEGVNIDGVCLADPFSRGNVQEIVRLLRDASVPVGTIFSRDLLEKTLSAAPVTIGTNEDFSSGVGNYLGGTLGFDEILRTFEKISTHCERSDIDPVIKELRQQEEETARVCDKFLRRYDPPRVIIFAGASYANFAARMLERFLDAEIGYIGTRNVCEISRYPGGQVTGLAQAKSLIDRIDPDLVVGSSFEHSVAKGRAFTGIIPPLRGTVRLAPAPLAGTNGSLSFIERILNACIDVHRPDSP